MEPLRPVGQLVLYFLKRLIKQENPYQACRGLRIFRPQPPIGHGFAVGGEERRGGALAPFVERSRKPALFVGGARERAMERRVNRKINRADEAGNVARRRQLAPPVGQRQMRISVEVDDEDIVLHDQSLPEAEVAMMTDVQPADLER